MKTEQEVNNARRIICDRITESGLEAIQKFGLQFILTTLVWVADGPNGTTIDRILAGESMCKSKEPGNE